MSKKHEVVEDEMEINCAICLDYFTNPRLLKCGHTFCFDCLKSVLLQQIIQSAKEEDKAKYKEPANIPKSSSIQCPTCRQITKLKKNLPITESLLKLASNEKAKVKIEVKKEEIESLPKICVECDDLAHSFCETCGFLCEDHDRSHKKSKRYQTHKVIYDFSSLGNVTITSVPTYSYCTDHSGEPLKLYCLPCQKPICFYCTLNAHKEHTYNLINEVCAKFYKDIHENFVVSQNQQKILDKQKVKIKSLKPKITKQTKDQTIEIEKAFDKLIENIENRKKALTIQLEAMAAIQDQRILEKEKNLTLLLDSFVTLNETADAFFSENSTFILQPSNNYEKNIEILQKMQNMKNSFEREMESANSFERHETFKAAVLSFEFKNNAKDLESINNIIKNFGDVTCAPIVNVVNNNNSISSTPSTTKNIYLTSNNLQNSIAWNYQSFFKEKMFGYKGNSDSQLEHPRFLVAHPHFNLAANPVQHFFIADGHNNRIKVVTKDGDYIRSFGRKGTMDAEFNFITGITVDYQTLFVFAADLCNHRIQIFSEDGTFIGKFGKNGNGPGEFNNPTGLAINFQTRHLYVSDYGNHRIQIFQILDNTNSNLTFNHIPGTKRFDISASAGPKNIPLSLQYIGEFGKIGEENGNMNSPNGICVHQKSGNLFIVDRGNNRVQVFDATGKYLNKFGSKGAGKGDFEGPNGICVSETDGHIFVCDTTNDRIQVFNENYAFVKCYGKGSENHHLTFNRPYGIGIAVLESLDAQTGPTLLFAVSEYWNHRIHEIFVKKL